MVNAVTLLTYLGGGGLQGLPGGMGVFPQPAPDRGTQATGGFGFHKIGFSTENGWFWENGS
jgi:hypothetical protein